MTGDPTAGEREVGEREAGRMPAWLSVAVMVVALAGGFGGWWFLARPAPIESRMPVAGSGPDSSGSDGSGSDGSGSDGSLSDGSVSDGANDSDPGGSTGSGNAGGEGTGRATVTVHVAGAVFEPGLVTLDDGTRVADAAVAAGGLTETADLDRINLAAQVSDGTRIYIPVKGQDVPPQVVAAGSPAGGAGGEPTVTEPLDLNSADAAALESLPGVGPTTAAAIVSHRDSEGPFRSVDALVEVRGIGEAKLEAIRDLVSVG